MSSHPTGSSDVTGAERALLADLLGTYDVLELLDRLLHVTVRAADAASAAILVPDDGGLEVLAATSETALDLDLFQAMTGEGPALDCLHHRETVVSLGRAAMEDRWPAFGAAATARGVDGVISMFMGVRGRAVGALNVFQPAAHDEEVLSSLQSLSDLAVLAVLQPHETAGEESRLAERLRRSLDRRVRVEMAKGVLAEELGITPDQAGPVLLAHARTSGRLLTDVAEDVVELRLDPATLRPRTG